MEPNRNYSPLDQSFDMSKLTAAMPPQVDQAYYHYQQQQPSIPGLGVSAASFYAPYHELQRPNIGGMPHSLPSNMSWRQQEMNNNLSFVRPKVHPWGVLPHQQHATMGGAVSRFGVAAAASNGGKLLSRTVSASVI